MDTELQQLIAEGYIAHKISDDGKLELFNYTDKTTYEKKWNRWTLNSRGSVFEIATGKQIAYPFTKFFNYSELTTEEQLRLAQNFDQQIDHVTKKMDGSLGILYWYDGQWRMNTRGSFTSEQAIKGLAIFQEQFAYRKHFESDRFKGYTFLFEIIYPEDRKIVNYGDAELLFLLSIFDDQGHELPIEDVQIFAESIGCDYPIQYTKLNTLDQIIAWQQSLDHTEEGCVVRMKDGTRYKFKSLKYLELAKLLNNVNPKTIWKQMQHGFVNKAFIQSVPEEFQSQLTPLVDQLENDYKTTLDYVGHLHQELSHKYNASSLEEFCKQLGQDPTIDKKHKAILFPMMRKQAEKMESALMQAIEPSN